MSIVQPSIPGARVLDLFAGSGALGLEALSRGAGSVDFVESGPQALRTLRENADTLGATGITIHRSDAMAFVEKLGAGTYDLAFADPPYRKGFAEAVVRRWEECAFANLLGVEHAATETMPGEGDTRRYGDTAITFYRV